MPRRRPRVLFLPPDGPRGIGHLSRASKLAWSIQEDAACVIATGLRDTCHLVPEHCEYVRLPGLEGGPGFEMATPAGWPFVGARANRMRSIRREILLALERAFAPDLIVTELLPTGWHGEWAEVLARTRAVKWITFRPVPGTNALERMAVAGGVDALQLYDEVLIAGDRRTSTVEEDLGPGEAARAKCRYLGYVSVPVPAAEIEAVRRRRGLGPDDRWVVCSAGAGLATGDLVQDCLRLVDDFPAARFDVIVGPRAPRSTELPADAPHGDGRLRVTGERRDLRVLHAAADVVICHGGYNSVSETMEGGAALIVDGRHDVNGERQRHARLLQPYYPLVIAAGVADMSRHLRSILSGRVDRRPIRDTRALDFDGCSDFARLVRSRLAREIGAAGEPSSSARTATSSKPVVDANAPKKKGATWLLTQDGPEGEG